MPPSQSILPAGIRTFKLRRGRMSSRQVQALEQPNPHLLTTRNISTAWQSEQPVILDIGFGSAPPVVEMARSQPSTVVLAVDVHTPGVASLVDQCARQDLTNVFVVEADALDVLPHLPAPLAGVRSFFPDPWPKVRHHKRRLVQPAVVQAVYEAVQPSGFWHLATDWAEYAASLIDVFHSHHGWRGGTIARPPWRPVTHFELRAIREGRPVVDVWMERI